MSLEYNKLNYMETEYKIMLTILIGIFLITGIAITIDVIGLQINMGEGSHIGYITSTEEIGLFFKTKTAYIKSDVQSSQEESYCVIDNKVFEKLKTLSEKHNRVEIKYFDWLVKGISNCNHENGGIINSVKEIL